MPDNDIRQQVLENVRKQTQEQMQQAQTQEEEVTDEEVVTEETQTQTQTEETKTDETTDEEVKKEEKEKEKDPEFETKRQREAFIRMRKEKEELEKQIREKSKYENTLEALAKRSNMTVEEYIQALDDNLLEEEAQSKNVDKETLKRIKKLEENERMFVEKERQMKVANKLVTLQTELNLSDDEVKDFIQEAMNEGYDLGNDKLNFTKVYKGLFADVIIEKEVKKAEQDRLARIKKNRESAPSIEKGGKGSTNTADTKADEESRKRAEALVKQRLGY